MRRRRYGSMMLVAALAAGSVAWCPRAGAAEVQPVEHYVRKLGLSFPNGKVPNKALRIALAGSSITWGNGYLDSSYPAYVDDYLRTALADTVRHDAMAVTGDHRVVKSPKLYGGSAMVLTGAGAACEFELEGDEVSVCLAIERDQATGTVVEILIDGKLHEEFTIRNEAPMGRDERTFTGDGKTVVFDLGRAFTYGHKVLRDGAELQGGLNTQGYGGRFKKGEDYMVVRKYAKGTPPQVHHMVWLAEPLAAGAKLTAAFNYGEAITYARTSIGERGRALDSPIESTYGDGDLNFRMDRPCAISRGLDFRYSDPRAVRTWRFAAPAKRRVRLVVKGGGNGKPSLIVNFATNRYHHIMNAGIGGWHAAGLNTDRGLRNYHEIIKFNPDIVTIEYGTNDDWNAGNTYIAYRSETGVSEETLRSNGTLWFRDVTPAADGTFDVNTSLLRIAAVSSRDITIDPAHVAFDADPIPGDILIIGTYHGDNRAVRTRLLASWDKASLKATFATPLAAADFVGLADLSELVGRHVQIKRIPHFLGQMTACIEGIRQAKPDAVLALVDTGYSNYRTRLLLGYPKKIEELSRQLGCKYVPTYGAVERWTFDPARVKDRHAFLGTAGNSIADGSAHYRLVTDQGMDAFDGRRLYRNFSVKVNGKERYGQGCTVDGGTSFVFKPGLAAGKIKISRWSSRPRGLTTRGCLPATLMFDQDIPPAGAKIEVACSTQKWSGDDCHLQGAPGAAIFGACVNRALKELLTP